MNEQKIAFIICYNNDLYLYECLKYISFLNVPEGIETETITILDAPGMAAGYNAAMRSTDAKYKVYLHQDVFILYEDFIYDVIEAFRKCPEYGMLGVIGGDNVPADANFWCNWNRGCTYSNDSLFQYNLKYSNNTNITSVSIIDGMMMITQCDIPWREDVFDGFDFYDGSQSAEFIKAGYKVGIPYQKQTWCMHDCGCSKLKNYDKYRNMFCKEYSDMGFVYSELPDQIDFVKRVEEIQKDIPGISKLIEEHSTIEAVNAINKTTEKMSRDTQFYILNILCQILLEEDNECVKNGFYRNHMDINGYIQQYYRYRLFLMRIYYNKPLEDLLDVCLELASQDKKGLCALKIISGCITLTQEESDDVIRKYLYLVG